MITVARETTKSEFTFVVSPMRYKERTAGTPNDNPSMFVDDTHHRHQLLQEQVVLLYQGYCIISTSAGDR